MSSGKLLEKVTTAAEKLLNREWIILNCPPSSGRPRVDCVVDNKNADRVRSIIIWPRHFLNLVVELSCVWRGI